MPLSPTRCCRRSPAAAPPRAPRPRCKRPDLYGKTGTTNDVVDAWFAGFQPDLVAVVWMGHDRPAQPGQPCLGRVAGTAGLDRIHGQAALTDVPVREVTPPEGVIKIDGNWRYAEWALGGGIVSLGLDDEAISPALIPQPPPSAAPD